MARAEDQELVERFEQFYRRYYSEAIGELARGYPEDRKSLFVDWLDLFQFDPDIAEDMISQPGQLREYAEEALRLYDLPVDVKLDGAHVRVRALDGTTDIRAIRAEHVNQLVSVQGMVRKATDVRPRITEAAFECQRCGTLNVVPQSGGGFQEPHECQGCERQGPFEVNLDQSQFVDAQRIRVQESPEGLRGGETPQSIDVNIEDDITGEVTPGDHVTVTGVLRLEQQERGGEKTAMFDVYMDGWAIEIEDEEFEDMEITDEDRADIVELSNRSDIYERMVDSVAPSIYGYRQEKLAMILQLFSGVTKHLPDGSRIRGDLHMLLIGDPGTGKCVHGDTRVTLGDGRQVQIRELVESNLDDPTPVDDGVHDAADIPLPSMAPDGTVEERRATRVWRREAPEQLYRVRTTGGRELEVTPSHPLFVQRDGSPQAVEAAALSEGEFVATAHDATTGADGEVPSSRDTDRDVVPDVGDELRAIRTALALPQSDCGLPRSTYQHYERGDRNPSRGRLLAVVERFEDRLEHLRATRARVADGGWADVEAVREDLGLAQAALAGEMGTEQRTVSRYERTDAVPDGGQVAAARATVLERLDEALGVAERVQSLRRLAASDIRWERIESLTAVDPDEDWVYDLEVPGSHSYVSNGVVSHNSAMLQYVGNIAPRSVYTSGKGSSAAGLCVTGDTLVHTADGFRPARALAETEHPTPVTEETAAPATHDVYTFDRESGEIETRESSHVWRMPERECRRIDTAHGKQLEVSAATPVLVCGTDGLEWREATEVEPGDNVAVPRYDDIERTDPSPREFLEFDEEKLKPTEAAVTRLRRRLREEFGTLRDAAAALDLSEDVIHDSLSNRHLPRERLATILGAVDLELEDIGLEQAMVRHGHAVTIPDQFDADLLYLVGLVFGDGDVRLSPRDAGRGLVRITNGDEAVLRRAAAIIEDAFGRSVEIERQPNRPPCIRLYSVTVARLFSELGVESPKDDLALHPRLTTAEHADAFLRGLFDADGSVTTRDDGGSSVQLSTTSPTLARQVQLMLETYGVRARRRERDRRGTYALEGDGPVTEIETTSVQHHLAVYGQDLDRFAEAVGFEMEAKAAALADLVDEMGTERRGERLPIGDTLVRADGAGGDYYNNLVRGDDPSRTRARELLADRALGAVHEPVAEVTAADLAWDEVTAVEATGEKEVFDLTVPGTHNFLADGVVTHNTAAAVRDDFGDGQQWTLEAGALVLADKGIAAIDELDKMSSDDRSAMHEALEQQTISISKAGINATLKSRCSLLGAANPKYGRFDQYEPIGEQIDLEPALISRFDLIFTVSDQPDEEEDRRLADHILQSNYAGELSTQRAELTTADVTEAEVDEEVEDVAPAIDAELLRKYVAHAKSSVYPTMSDAARERIREFYVDLRSRGAEEDSPVPVTARQLEALVRLAEASARLRLSDTVAEADAERVIEIVRSSLEDIGVDPETGEFDADVVEVGQSKTQRDRAKSLRGLVTEIEEEYEDGAPVEEVLDRAEEAGHERSKAEHEIEKLKQKGEVYQPSQGHLRTT